MIGGAGAMDMTTSNVYLGNLSMEVTEQALMMEFGRFGPIASVKVMWARTDEEKARGRHCGFVSYMKREYAEQCVFNMHGMCAPT
jgi:U2-associated protein SR140